MNFLTVIMLPLEEEETVVLLMLLGPSVCSQTKLFQIIILNIFYHRAFIFHMLIGLGEDKYPIDFGFTRSKVEVTRYTL